MRQEKEFVITMSRRGTALTAPALVSKRELLREGRWGGWEWVSSTLVAGAGWSRGGRTERCTATGVSARVLGEALGGKAIAQRLLGAAGPARMHPTVDACHMLFCGAPGGCQLWTGLRSVNVSEHILLVFWIITKGNGSTWCSSSLSCLKTPREAP